MSIAALNDLGIVCALGCGATEVRSRLLAGTALSQTMDFRCREGAAFVGRSPRQALAALPAELVRFDCLNNRLLYTAFLQIAPSVQAAVARFGANRVGVVLGSSTSGLDATEAAFYAEATGAGRPRSYDFFAQHAMGGMVDLLRAAGNLQGPGYVVSTACSSSAKALISARGMLDLGLCDAVVCGGADALCDLTLQGFDALASVASELTNPVSVHRQGLNLGEGAALFLMTRAGGPVYLTGAGESSDAHHLSAPHPEGIGAEAAMRAALADAGLAPHEIHYVNLHGTGTPLNDAMEAQAVSRVFGMVPCSSTKPMTGHTLGAAGAIEAALCYLVLCQPSRERLLPPHLYDGAYDPALPPISLCAVGEQADFFQPWRFLSCSYAFGGSNCALVLSSAAEAT